MPSLFTGLMGRNLSFHPISLVFTCVNNSKDMSYQGYLICSCPQKIWESPSGWDLTAGHCFLAKALPLLIVTGPAPGWGEGGPSSTMPDVGTFLARPLLTSSAALLTGDERLSSPRCPQEGWGSITKITQNVPL